MIKKYILIIGTLVCLGAVSCEEYENSAEPSTITYLPLMSMEGEDEYVLECGSTQFDDPGARATIGGEDVPVQTTVVGQFFGNENFEIPDVYQIRYSAVNEDEIPGLSVRQVVIPACTDNDILTNLEGMYAASVERTTVSSGAINSDYANADFTPYYVVDLGDGKYGFSDVIGGFYMYGYEYGPDYAGTGFVVQANNIATNDFEVVATNGVGAFGGDVEVTDFNVDPVAGTISWTVDWSFGYTFDVVLEKL